MRGFQRIGMAAGVMGLMGAMLGMLPEAVSAQSQSSGDRVEQETQQLKERLGLTDDQTAKVRAILQNSHAQMEQARANAQGDRGTMRDTMKTQREQTDQAISAVLTDEQRTKFTQLQSDRRQRMHDHTQEHGGSGGDAQSGEELWGGHRGQGDSWEGRRSHEGSWRW